MVHRQLLEAHRGGVREPAGPLRRIRQLLTPRWKSLIHLGALRCLEGGVQPRQLDGGWDLVLDWATPAAKDGRSVRATSLSIICAVRPADPARSRKSFH